MTPQPDACIICGAPLEDGDGFGWCVNCDPRTEIEKLRRQVAELEAQLAATTGSVAPAATSEPAQFAWNVPPNAPGNERS